IKPTKSSRESAKGAGSPPPLWPVVSKAEPIREITEAEFQQLEAAGRITLSDEARRAVRNIAAAWISHDRTLHSPRPREFRSRLRAIRNALERAHSKSDFLGPDSTAFDHHLYHWLMDSQIPGLADALNQLAST